MYKYTTPRQLKRVNTKRGTNQYKKKYKKGNMGLLLVIPAYFLIALFFRHSDDIFNSVHKAEAQEIVSPVVSETPTPYLTPTATPTPYIYDTVGAIKRIWGKDYKIGLAISSCESGTNPNRYHINTNGTLDFGVFQINTVHGTILDPEENIRYAYHLYQEQGLGPWYSSQKCWEAKL